MTKTKKSAIIVSVLIILFCICLAYSFYLFSHSGQGSYSGKNLDNYIIPGEYKNISVKFTSDDPGERRRQVWEQIVQSSEVKKYPDKQVKEYYNMNLEYYEELSKAYGYSDFDTYIKERHGCSREEFEEFLTGYARSQVANDMLVYAIAKKESLEMSDEEYEKLLKESFKDQGFTEESFEKTFHQSMEEYGEEHHLRVNFLQEKVMDRIMESVTGK